MFFRTITAIVSILTAVILLAISLRAAMVATRYVQVQQPNAAIFPTIVTLFAFYVALLLAMPAARQKLLARCFRPFGRFFFILLCIVTLAILSIAAKMVIDSEIPTLYGVFPTKFILPYSLAFGALFIMTFIYPGLAFQELRNFVKTQDNDVATYTPTTKKARRSQGLIKTIFGGTPSPQSAVSRISKYTYSLLFIAYIVIGAYGLRVARFLPTKAHLDFVSEQQLILSAIPIAILAFLILLWQRTPGKGPFRSIAVQKFGFILLVSGIIIALAVPLLTKGLPDLYSFISNGPIASETVTVTEVGVRKRKGGCDNTATVALMDDSNAQILICDVPSEIWEGLKPGHILTLSGTQTTYGLHYASIEPVEKIADGDQSPASD